MAVKRLLIINGPNLNLLGTREAEIYGNRDFDDFLVDLRAEFNEIEIEYFQSNIEGEIIDCIQDARSGYEGMVINAGGYSHTSIAISDALAILDIPVIEVHISNIYQREEFRHQTLLAKHCKGIIAGLGLDSYKMAVQYLIPISGSV